MIANKMDKISTELSQAMAAKKCWRCGCFQDTVNALNNFTAITKTLGRLLNEAQNLFEPKTL